MEASTDTENPEQCQLIVNENNMENEIQSEVQKESAPVADNLNDFQASQTVEELQPDRKDAVPDSPNSELNISKVESTVSFHDDDTSSGSPSPIPDDSNDVLEASVRPKVRLGKDISMMMKALNCLNSPEEKIATLCKKYADLLEQYKLEQKRLRTLQKKHNMFKKEHDQLQATHNKTVLVKSNMESLARELNKQNKLLKEETYVKMTQMEKDKEQVTVKFQAAIDEISGKIESIAGRNSVLHEENKDMGTKIAALSEQANSREHTIGAMTKHHGLQEKLLLDKLQKSEEEKMASLKEQQKYVMQCLETKVLCTAYEAREKELRTQLKYYSDKFEDFQSTLENSNKMFATFRNENSRMNKKIKELEKKNTLWELKCMENEKALKLMVLEKMKLEKLTKQFEQKQTLLTNLSRALQTERNEMAKKIKSYEQKEKSKTASPENKFEECTESVGTDSFDKIQGNVEETIDEHQENQQDHEEQQTVKICDLQQDSKEDVNVDSVTQTKCAESSDETAEEEVKTSEEEVETVDGQTVENTNDKASPVEISA